MIPFLARTYRCIRSGVKAVFWPEAAGPVREAAGALRGLADSDRSGDKLVITVKTVNRLLIMEA